MGETITWRTFASGSGAASDASVTAVVLDGSDTPEEDELEVLVSKAAVATATVGDHVIRSGITYRVINVQELSGLWSATARAPQVRS